MSRSPPGQLRRRARGVVRSTGAWSVGRDDEATYRVATTLSVYLQETRSRARAARRLTVHPNTVSYRVDQAQTILGRSIDTDSLDLAVALVTVSTLPGLVRERRTTEA